MNSSARALIVIATLIACFGPMGTRHAGAERRDLDLSLSIEQDGRKTPLATEQTDGMQCTVIELPATGEPKISATGEFNWTDSQALVFRAKLAGDTPRPVQLIFFFQDVDFWWFQKLLRAEPVPGEWTEITVPLSAQPADAGNKYAWRSIGHSKPYDRNALRKARCVGLIVVPTAEQQENVRPARLLLAQPQLVLDEQATERSPRLYGLASPPSVKRYERFEATFQLDKTYTNPFDPEEIDVQAHVTTPSGRTVRVFGFWYQNYRRRVTGRSESLVPVGEPTWKVRFTPSETGLHSYTITVRDAAGPVTTQPRRFEVLDGPRDGFLRVSSDDYHYLRFDSGRSWWGIGLNLHCTYDYRYYDMVRGRQRLIETERGSLFYDDRLKKCAENGMNWTELWIASWGFEIEWRGDWRGWAGTGHYSLENAWRLDRVLRQCSDYGIYVNLVLSCHGAYNKGTHQVSTGRDDEFQHHAYYRGNGGWLDDGGQIFTNPRAHKAMRNRLRYIIARYGHSTNIATWEMISESDLVPGRHNAVRPFVFLMAEMVKEMDPYAHLIGNHYCGNYDNIDPLCARDPRMNVVAGDTYRGGYSGRTEAGRRWRIYFEPLPKNLVKAARSFNTYRKPVFVTECGGQWFAGPAPLLEADVHALNWSAWMTTLPATPLTWWEEFVDENDLYREYAAFARYAAGEDKSGRDLTTREAPVKNIGGNTIPRLTTMMLTNRTGGYVWVYDEEYFEFGSSEMSYRGKSSHGAIFHLKREHDIRRFEEAVAAIGGLEDGVFDVEIWDTTAGKALSTLKLETQDGAIAVPLPEFSRDIALKLKKRLY